MSSPSFALRLALAAGRPRRSFASPSRAPSQGRGRRLVQLLRGVGARGWGTERGPARAPRLAGVSREQPLSLPPPGCEPARAAAERGGAGRFGLAAITSSVFSDA